MCMKYETEYEGGCWDWMMFGDDYSDYSLKLFLQDWYGVKIENEQEFMARLLELFEEFHVKKVIRPLTDDENKSLSDDFNARHRCLKCGNQYAFSGDFESIP